MTTYTPDRIVDHRFDGVWHRVALPITFTPFASAKPCSARCVFCSETLMHNDAGVLGAQLRPPADYGAMLRRALAALRGLPIGISLSGLESTDDRSWLLDVLDAIDAHAQHSPIDDRVLYTNTAGLAVDVAEHGPLLKRLRTFALTRAEVSRHAVDEDANQAIMRFREHVTVAKNAVFARTVEALRAEVPVRLVCVIQKGGVFDVDSARAYIEMARDLGVDDVVFRELSRTGDAYRQTTSLRMVDDARVPIAAVAALAAADGYRCIAEKRGYYYANTRHVLDDARGRMMVTFEHSDYVDMKAQHDSGVVHKLVFFANGHLCGDWDPQRQVLARFASQVTT